MPLKKPSRCSLVEKLDGRHIFGNCILKGQPRPGSEAVWDTASLKYPDQPTYHHFQGEDICSGTPKHLAHMPTSYIAIEHFCDVVTDPWTLARALRITCLHASIFYHTIAEKAYRVVLPLSWKPGEMEIDYRCLISYCSEYVRPRSCGNSMSKIKMSPWLAVKACHSYYPSSDGGLAVRSLNPILFQRQVQYSSQLIWLLVYSISNVPKLAGQHCHLWCLHWPKSQARVSF